jgi:hypothetical protein
MRLFVDARFVLGAKPEKNLLQKLGLVPTPKQPVYVQWAVAKSTGEYMHRVSELPEFIQDKVRELAYFANISKAEILTDEESEAALFDFAGKSMAATNGHKLLLFADLLKHNTMYALNYSLVEYSSVLGKAYVNVVDLDSWDSIFKNYGQEVEPIAIPYTGPHPSGTVRMLVTKYNALNDLIKTNINWVNEREAIIKIDEYKALQQLAKDLEEGKLELNPPRQMEPGLNVFDPVVLQKRLDELKLEEAKKISDSIINTPEIGSEEWYERFKTAEVQPIESPGYEVHILQMPGIQLSDAFATKDEGMPEDVNEKELCTGKCEAPCGSEKPKSSQPTISEKKPKAKRKPRKKASE